MKAQLSALSPTQPQPECHKSYNVYLANFISALLANSVPIALQKRACASQRTCIIRIALLQAWAML